MANTVTQRTLLGSGSSRNVVKHIHIVYVDGQESDLVIYDNSAFVNDTSKGNVQRIIVSGSPCELDFEWDQTTDSPVCTVAQTGSDTVLDFRPFGGIPNPNGTGATGDLVLTSRNLGANDAVTIIVEISQE